MDVPILIHPVNEQFHDAEVLLMMGNVLNISYIEMDFLILDDFHAYDYQMNVCHRILYYKVDNCKTHKKNYLAKKF